MSNYVLTIQVGDTADAVRIFTDRHRALEYVTENFLEILMESSTAGDLPDDTPTKKLWKRMSQNIHDIRFKVRTFMGSPLNEASEIWLDALLPDDPELQVAMFTIIQVARDTSKAAKAFDDPSMMLPAPIIQ